MTFFIFTHTRRGSGQRHIYKIYFGSSISIIIYEPGKQEDGKEMRTEGGERDGRDGRDERWEMRDER